MIYCILFVNIRNEFIMISILCLYFEWMLWLLLVHSMWFLILLILFEWLILFMTILHYDIQILIMITITIITNYFPNLMIIRYSTTSTILLYWTMLYSIIIHQLFSLLNHELSLILLLLLLLINLITTLFTITTWHILKYNLNFINLFLYF